MCFTSRLFLCRERLRKAERESDRLKDLAQERQRQIYADNVTDSLHMDKPLFQRQQYRNRYEILLFPCAEQTNAKRIISCDMYGTFDAAECIWNGRGEERRN